jgi:hypothetical protein
MYDYPKVYIHTYIYIIYPDTGSFCWDGETGVAEDNSLSMGPEMGKKLWFFLGPAVGNDIMGNPSLW